MAEPKTRKTTASPIAFIKTVKDKEQQKDSMVLLKMFSEITGDKPVMWGTSIVGYGQYHYKSERSSQEGDWMLTGFSPRKANLSIYVHPVNIPKKLLSQLGPHSTSMGCLYIKRLSDVDQKVLKQVIKVGIKELKKMLYSKVRRGPVQGKASS